MKYYSYAEPGPIPGSHAEIVISEADLKRYIGDKDLEDWLTENWAWECDSPLWAGGDEMLSTEGF